MLRRPALLLALVVALAAGPARGQTAPSAPSKPASAPAARGRAASIFDDPAARALAIRGLDAVNDLRFDEAERAAAEIEAAYPRHPAAPLLRGLALHWRVLLDLTNGRYDTAFMARMDEVVRRSDALLKRDKRNFDARFFRGAALGFKSRMHSNRNRWVPAASAGKDALDDVLYVARRNPSNADYGFGKGVYDYFSDVARERYAIARPLLLFFPDGDRPRGLAALTRAAEGGTFMRTEAAYQLAQIYYLYEEDYTQTMRYVRVLRERHPNNAFFLALEGRVQARWGRWAEARAAFDEVLAAYDAGRAEYVGLAEQALFSNARADLLDGQPDSALVRLARLDTLTGRFGQGQSYFRVFGRLRQGQALDAAGRRDEALARYREVLEMRDYADAHERARGYIERPYQ